jgi:uncharacterized protein (TIGR02231 family)
MQVVSSVLKKVVVFSDRAQASRHAKVEIVPGEQVFSFEDLPQDMDRKLLQVQCMKGATNTEMILQCVEHVTEHTTKDVSPERAALEAKISALEDNLTDMRDRIEVLDLRLSSLSKVVTRATYQGETAGDARFDVGAWDQVLQYSWKGQDGAKAQKRALEREKTKMDAEMSMLRSSLAQLGGASTSQSKEKVHVTISAKKAGSAVLVLTYVIPNASWTPLYDARVDSVKRTLVVSYHGVIRQTTSETWTDVEVELSTAAPQIGGNAPELQPWRICKATPYNQYSDYSRSRGEAMQQMMNCYIPPSAASDSSALTADVLTVSGAAINTKATSVFFNISGLQTIKNDSTECKVTIFQQEFPAHFRYSTVPKLSTHAYLKAKAVNSTECPLLPGDVNVFLDNNFVSTSTMDLVPPASDFWVFLGVDDSISVSHKLINQKVTHEGGMLSSKKARTTYTYVITVKNTKKSQEEVVVWDQIPIAQDGKITVELVDAFAKGTDNMKINDVNYVEWFLNLAPSQEQKIPLSFYVECPEGDCVSGL